MDFPQGKLQFWKIGKFDPEKSPFKIDFFSAITFW